MIGRSLPSPHINDVLALCERVKRDFSVSVILGLELEFYTDITQIDVLKDALLPCLELHHIHLVEWVAEDGEGQWELAIAHDPLEVSLPKFLALRKALKRIAEHHNIPLSLAAKPHHDQPASGLHLHLHLENEAGLSLFTKRDHEISSDFANALAGLLRMMPASMPYFMPSDESYARLREGEHVPAHICWGVNNRSAALRIPESKERKSEIKHIEHRVCGADADPVAAVWSVLVGLHVGLSQDFVLPEPLYGMARDAQYDAPRLPYSPEEAGRSFLADGLMQHYVSELSSISTAS